MSGGVGPWVQPDDVRLPQGLAIDSVTYTRQGGRNAGFTWANLIELSWEAFADQASAVAPGPNVITPTQVFSQAPGSVSSARREAAPLDVTGYSRMNTLALSVARVTSTPKPLVYPDVIPPGAYVEHEAFAGVYFGDFLFEVECTALGTEVASVRFNDSFSVASPTDAFQRATDLLGWGVGAIIAGGTSGVAAHASAVGKVGVAAVVASQLQSADPPVGSTAARVDRISVTRWYRPPRYRLVSEYIAPYTIHHAGGAGTGAFHEGGRHGL